MSSVNSPTQVTRGRYFNKIFHILTSCITPRVSEPDSQAPTLCPAQQPGTTIAPVVMSRPAQQESNDKNAETWSAGCNKEGVLGTLPAVTIGTITGWQILAAEMAQNPTSIHTSLERTPQHHRHRQQQQLHPHAPPQTEPSYPRLDSDNAEHQMQTPERSLSAMESDLTVFASVAAGQLSPGAAAMELSHLDSPTATSAAEQLSAQYDMLSELGKGAFGRAYKARRRADGLLTCIKTIELGHMSKKERHMTKNEVAVLSQLIHPHVVSYMGCFFDHTAQHIVMEYCEGGDLERYLKKKVEHQLEEDEIMMIFVQLCLALHYVHQQGIIHRDLKTSNIFLTQTTPYPIVKLGDFGIAKVLGLDGACASTLVGTPYYLSPEVVQDKPYNAKSDVWAAGCVLYELSSLKRPFLGQSVSAIAVKILKASPPPLPPFRSPDLQQLVSLLLRRRPEERPSMAEILQLDYLQPYLERHKHMVGSALLLQRAQVTASSTSVASVDVVPAPATIVLNRDDPAPGLTALPVTDFLMTRSLRDAAASQTQAQTCRNSTQPPQGALKLSSTRPFSVRVSPPSLPPITSSSSTTLHKGPKPMNQPQKMKSESSRKAPAPIKTFISLAALQGAARPATSTTLPPTRQGPPLPLIPAIETRPTAVSCGSKDTIKGLDSPQSLLQPAPSLGTTLDTSTGEAGGLQMALKNAVRHQSFTAQDICIGSGAGGVGRIDSHKRLEPIIDTDGIVTVNVLGSGFDRQEAVAQRRWQRSSALLLQQLNGLMVVPGKRGRNSIPMAAQALHQYEAVNAGRAAVQDCFEELI